MCLSRSFKESGEDRRSNKENKLKVVDAELRNEVAYHRVLENEKHSLEKRVNRTIELSEIGIDNAIDERK
jgi:hypothetical protein